MTDESPKDMTASELLRWIADHDNQSNCQGCNLFYASDECGGHTCSDWKRDLADKIDAELAHARRSGLERAAKLWAKANGWPDFKPGEDFGAWLNRCAIPRPRYEDGEPVLLCDEWKAIFVSLDGTRFQLVDSYPDGLCLAGDRVKRPAPEALGADGKPIVKGETAYRTDRPTTEINILYIRSYDDGSSDVVYREGDSSLTKMCDPSLITHTPPDTQERIEEDAVLDAYKYWGCVAIGNCENCPAKVDGDKPYKRYQADDCTQAMVRDLLRRQRELDKRTGGE